MSSIKNYLSPIFIFAIFIVSQISVIAQDSLNISVYKNINRGDTRYSGSWAYIDSLGNEYALIGARTGLAAYSIDDTASNELGFIPGPHSNWREITVVDKHAYVTTEGSGEGEGLQIVDLSYLPDSLHLRGTYSETFTRGHILQRDIYTNEPYIYINGTTATEGVHILDVSNPDTLVEVGLYQPGYYIHDCHVKNNLIYACAFNNATVDIVDVSDKTNPTLIQTIVDPGANTHSCWLSEDDNYLYVCDERDGLPARVFDMQDIDNITPVHTFTANDSSLVHNPYVKGDFLYIAHNTEGLRIYDIVDPSLPIEVGFYDTFNGPSGGFSGLWSACPYFPSGKIIGGDRTRGLFVWTFEETYAGRINATVRDSVTKEIIPVSEVIIQTTNDTLQTNFDGIFKLGGIPDTSFQVTINAAGYLSKTITLAINEPVSTDIFIDLVSFTSSNKDIQNILSLKVSPNPFLEFTHVDFSNLKDAQELILYNHQGRIIESINIQSTSSVLLKEQLKSSGVYYYIVKNKKAEIVANGKLVKL